jgi:hypothetical protein
MKEDEDHWQIPMDLADKLTPEVLKFLKKYVAKNKKLLQSHEREDLLHHEVVTALMILTVAMGHVYEPFELITTFAAVLNTVKKVSFGGDHPESGGRLH